MDLPLKVRNALRTLSTRGAIFLPIRHHMCSCGIQVPSHRATRLPLPEALRIHVQGEDKT